MDTMNREEYYKQFGWNKSPFIKSTSLDTPIVNREEEYKEMCECIGGWDRIMVTTAPIGYGKTTFMNQLSRNPPASIKYVAAFNAYEPAEEVINRIKHTLPIWKRIFSRNIDRTTFGEFLHKRLKEDKMLLLFDESQDYEEEVFKWLRMLNDRVDNLFMVFLGLKGLEKKITAETSFRDRKSKSITLRPLNKAQLREIVISRIKWVGGSSIKPFTEDGLDRLCDSAANVPRQLLENGQRVIEVCSRSGLDSIDGRNVEEILGGFEEHRIELAGPERVYEPLRVVKESEPVGPYSNFFDDLSPTQRGIVNLLMEHESLSISELSSMLDKDLRSVGSLVRKLRGLNESEVKRKPNVPYPVVVRVGKDTRMGRLQYVYSLSDSVRRFLAQR
jgi:type II secretory pathway predicted ATPase ExeA